MIPLERGVRILASFSPLLSSSPAMVSSKQGNTEEMKNPYQLLSDGIGQVSLSLALTKLLPILTNAAEWCNPVAGS